MRDTTGDGVAAGEKWREEGFGTGAGSPLRPRRGPRKSGFSHWKLARSGLRKRSLRLKSDPARGHLSLTPALSASGGGAAWKGCLAQHPQREARGRWGPPAAGRRRRGGWRGRPACSQVARAGLACPPPAPLQQPRRPEGWGAARKEAGECGGAGETEKGCREERKKGEEQKGRKRRRAEGTAERKAGGRWGGDSGKGGRASQRGGRHRERRRDTRTGRGRARGGRDCERGSKAGREGEQGAAGAASRERGQQRASGERQRVKWARRRRRRRRRARGGRA